MNRFILTAGVIIVLAIGGFYFLISHPKDTSTSIPQMQIPSQTPTQKSEPFTNPKKSAHYENNTPEHGLTVAGVPINVVINFNFDLAPPSSISITMDGKEYGVGETVIDANKLSMRRKMDPQSPDGIYTVSYNACWPDKTCHDGNFQFKIDRELTSSYKDLTGQTEVTINLKDISFSPKNVRISKGTKVTWVNDDAVEHYVNTESHPAHTYYLAQNSKALKNGDQYSLIFDQEGIYPYHCSSHADSMSASILVE